MTLFYRVVSSQVTQLSLPFFYCVLGLCTYPWALRRDALEADWERQACPGLGTLQEHFVSRSIFFPEISLFAIFLYHHDSGLLISTQNQLVYFTKSKTGSHLCQKQKLRLLFPIDPWSQSKCVSHKMLVDFVFPDFQGHLYYKIQRFGFREFAFALG